MPEGLGCDLLLTPSHLHPPAITLFGEQHPVLDLGVCRRALWLCKRGVFSQGGSGVKQEWAGSLKTWLRGSGQAHSRVSGQTGVWLWVAHLPRAPHLPICQPAPAPSPLQGAISHPHHGPCAANGLERTGNRPLFFFFLQILVFTRTNLWQLVL